MDQTKLQYLVEIAKSGDGGSAAAKELQAVGVAGEKAGQSLASAGREFKAALAAFASAAVIRESIQAFTEQDAAVRRLDGTLIALGRTGGDTSRALQALAQSVVLPPGATRNSVLDAISELVRNGASNTDLPRLTQQVLDLAAAGYSMERASDAMGNAIAGDFGKLSKILNVDFPAAAGRTKNLADALGLVEQRFGGLAAATSGGLGGQLAQFSQAATSLKASLGEILMTGASPYLKNFAESMQWWHEIINGKPGQAYERPAWAPGGPLRAPLAEAVNPNKNYDPTTAQRLMADLQRDAQLRAMRNDVPILRPRESVALSGAAGPEATLLPANQLMRAGAALEVELLGKLLGDGIIKGHEFDEALRAVQFRLGGGLAQAAREGYQVLQETHRAQLGDVALRVGAINDEFLQRRNAINDYVEYARTQVTTERERLNLIREQKVALEELDQQQRVAAFSATHLGRELKSVGEQGVQSFAGGLSNGLMQVIQGTKSAKAAMQEFAASFLSNIAQMIMQALILATIKRALSGTSAGAFLGFADGGIAPRQMAAGGLQSVSSATYFPQFGAIAGEAGTEIMAVLSRPRMMDMGGLASYVGKMQGRDMAMTDAGELRSAVGGQRSAGGLIVIEVRGSQDFETRLISSSVERAVVQINTELATDSATSAAVKSLTA